LNECVNIDVKKAVVAYQCANTMRIYLTVTEEYISDERFLYCKSFLDKHAIEVVLDRNSRGKIKIALIMYLLRVPRSVIKFL